MEDNGGLEFDMVIGDSVSGQVHKLPTGNVIIMGGLTTTPGLLCEGKWIREVRHKNTALVDTGYVKGVSYEHL